MKKITIGRTPDNTIVFNEPTVSGHHATLMVEDNGSMTLTDHSTNGTMVNGRKIKNETVGIHAYDDIRFPGGNMLDMNKVLSDSSSTVRIGQSTERFATPVSQPSPEAAAPQFRSSEADYGHQASWQQAQSAPASVSTPASAPKDSCKRPVDMSFGEAISSVFSKYATFTGRARRKEYWYFFLFNLMISIGTLIVDVLIGLSIFSTLWSLAILIPSLALNFRRLHDTGRSGWYILFALIPLVGSILLLVWFCMDSEPGSNKYGSNPKGID